FLVWLVLSILYYTVPMIHMPTTARVWGLGALLFFVLAAVTAVAQRKSRRRRASDEPKVAESQK
ncbi:MAG: hypothetical protein ACE5KL_07750, partial [Alphaproteobacteria bacterium]